MKVATYNVNSINARLPNLLAFLAREKPDIMMLQEIKCSFNDFPLFELNSAGYNVKFIGQKSYNGVAILSPYKILNVIEGLPKFEDENARYIEADVVVEGDVVRVASLYLPNGNPPYNNPDDESKFVYKLNWMNAFYARAAQLLESGKKVILGGDYNVILTDLMFIIPRCFAIMLCLERKLSSGSKPLNILDIMMLIVAFIRRRSAILIGIMPEVLWQWIRECESIICFCRRGRLMLWKLVMLTDRPAVAINLQIMRRWLPFLNERWIVCFPCLRLWRLSAT